MVNTQNKKIGKFSETQIHTHLNLDCLDVKSVKGGLKK
ncbi:Uncharacterised protein [uncultured archaeon]|nr:Uncharacterised protein [uncultured archaeon]